MRSLRKRKNDVDAQKRAASELRRRLKMIVKKESVTRTEGELELLAQWPAIVNEIEHGMELFQRSKQRKLEVLDDPEVIDKKCSELAEAFRQSKSIVVYTGAGISTAAAIPDYRGPNGIWSKLSEGKEVSSVDLTKAVPTFTHMCLAKMVQDGLVTHVVSQNCDGLHVRSSLERSSLSEVHGNMYTEVCSACDQLYFRLFDVTEQTSLYRHNTGRTCTDCKSPLRDTIVHFGEKGCLEQPLNWQRAVDAAIAADMILCLGSSLKVLRSYKCLWGMERIKQRRPKLYIVNLQYTSKDPVSTLKINAHCDTVMRRVAEELNLNIPAYKRSNDPLYDLAKDLKSDEIATISDKHIPSRDFPLPSDTTTVKTENTVAIKDTDTWNERDPSDTDNPLNGNVAPVRKPLPGWFGKGMRKGVKRKRVIKS
ncbi:NAD-dependent protein deacetylase sirtuin-7-like [Corticium candelabrum]|uniref:NAD-dependent protein deacetylase sirtuin-7-like n=1 Tax=Corticium candelabrum TaxID=121492 RepID=UPI002E3599FB|nr:NAD-dependent protein deacetylase sirtuin-7-like [Corticium candelabrum]